MYAVCAKVETKWDPPRWKCWQFMPKWNPNDSQMWRNKRSESKSLKSSSGRIPIFARSPPTMDNLSLYLLSLPIPCQNTIHGHELQKLKCPFVEENVWGGERINEELSVPLYLKYLPANMADELYLNRTFLMAEIGADFPNCVLPRGTTRLPILNLSSKKFQWDANFGS